MLRAVQDHFVAPGLLGLLEQVGHEALPQVTPPGCLGDDHVLDVPDFTARVDELALDDEGGRAQDGAGGGVWLLF